MLPDRVSNPGPLTYESDALPIALRGLAFYNMFIPFSLVNLLHIGILRKECNKSFLAIINCFTSIVSNLYLHVRQMGV